MVSYGTLPPQLSQLSILEQIGEHILIADSTYHLRWMNAHAIQLMDIAAPLFGLKDAQDMIGKNMAFFHKNPSYQEKIMDKLDEIHRTQIQIKDQYIAEIVVTPIKNKAGEIHGYVVMLMDVTEKAQKEKEKESLIRELSVPIIKLWNKVLAVPIIGVLDEYRADELLERALARCLEESAQYILFDLSGLREMDDFSGAQIDRMHAALRLLGVECLIVGISARLALSMNTYSFEWKTFSSTMDGLKYVIQKENYILTPPVDIKVNY